MISSNNKKASRPSFMAGRKILTVLEERGHDEDHCSYVDHLNEVGE